MSSLDFLHNVSGEELEALADIIREKGGITSSLSGRRAYSDNSAYVDAIINELLDFGSNTLWTQKGYNTVLEDVCDKMDVNYSDNDSTEENENKLLAKVFSGVWEEMSDEGRKAILESMNEHETPSRFGGSAAVFGAIFRAGGFKSYQLSVIVANSLAKFVLGRGLAFGTNAILTRALSYVAGPFGILMGIWTAIQIMGPAYRVTVPAVTYIAALRKIARGK